MPTLHGKKCPTIGSMISSRVRRCTASFADTSGAASDHRVGQEGQSQVSSACRSGHHTSVLKEILRIIGPELNFKKCGGPISLKTVQNIFFAFD